MTADQSMFGRTIQLFLIDGVPDGLMIATIHGWTGSVLVGTETTLARLLARSEADRTGVYILSGPDPVDPLKTRAYIGEADCVRERLADSVRNRTFWQTAVVVTTSDEALTKGHVRYLEARLIQLVAEAGRARLDNTQQPSADRRRLPEADRASMEAFLANLKTVLPIIGLDLLKPQPFAISHSGITDRTQTVQFEIRTRSGINAIAVEEAGEFVVLQDSRAAKDAGHQSNGYAQLKRELVDQNILVPTIDGSAYEFRQGYPFKSPSAAAAVVLDRNANGRTEWKVIGSKATYHEWQEANAVQSSVS